MPKQANEQTRFEFEQYVYVHLQRKALPESIRRRRMFVCSSCGFAVTDQLVRLKRERGLNWVDCPVCQTRISLLDKEERLTAEPAPAVQEMDRAADRQRDLAVAESVRQGKREAGEFDVFLCYNAEDRAAVKRIGELLKEQEILPWLD